MWEDAFPPNNFRDCFPEEAVGLRSTYYVQIYNQDQQSRPVPIRSIKKQDDETHLIGGVSDSCSSLMEAKVPLRFILVALAVVVIVAVGIGVVVWQTTYVGDANAGASYTTV